MSSFYPVSGSRYTAPTSKFASLANTGGVDVFASLSESLANARKTDPNGWTQISAPQKNSPGSSKSVPLGSQRALRRDVEEPASSASGVAQAKPFDAGRIANNSGRIAILGQVGAKDPQDSYKITVSTDGKLNLFAPNPDYNSKTAGSKISLGDAKVELFDAKGGLVATSDTTNATGFSNWISLSTEGLGGLQVSKGEYTVKITRDKGVADTTKVNYSVFAVMGDPGATTFYTVKKTPLSADEQKKADQAAAVSAAKQSANSGASSPILSLFS